MAENTITVSRRGGTPQVEVFIGQGQFGKYQMFLWDQTGHHPQPNGAGVNTDEIRDQFPIGAPVSELDRRLFNWEVIVAALGRGGNQRYFVSIQFTQDGAPVPVTHHGVPAQDGKFVYQGALNQVEFIFDIARFIVQ
jgi:hypothetical protein